MTKPTLETVYERLAETIDRVGEADTPLFLAKAALLLAEALGDPERALALIEAASRDLDEPG
jgi:hypothetical protein